MRTAFSLAGAVIVVATLAGCAGRQTDPVADTQYMRVHRHGRLAERHVKHNIGGLAPDARQFDQLVTVAWHLAAIVADQGFRK